MPGCHPGLLFQVFPFTISRVYHSLLPFDPNCIVTGNLVFIFGTLKKATLGRKEERENKSQHFSARKGKLEKVGQSKGCWWDLYCHQSVSQPRAKMQWLWKGAESNLHSWKRKATCSIAPVFKWRKREKPSNHVAAGTRAAEETWSRGGQCQIDAEEECQPSERSTTGITHEPPSPIPSACRYSRLWRTTHTVICENL